MVTILDQLFVRLVIAYENDFLSFTYRVNFNQYEMKIGDFNNFLITRLMLLIYGYQLMLLLFSILILRIKFKSTNRTYRLASIIMHVITMHCYLNRSWLRIMVLSTGWVILRKTKTKALLRALFNNTSLELKRIISHTFIKTQLITVKITYFHPQHR